MFNWNYWVRFLFWRSFSQWACWTVDSYDAHDGYLLYFDDRLANEHDGHNDYDAMLHYLFYFVRKLWSGSGVINSDLTANQNDRYMKLRYSVQVEGIPVLLMTIYKLIAGYIIKQMQENWWVMSLSSSLSWHLFQTFLFIECSWFVTKKLIKMIGLSINHGITHANQLWFSQQGYGANHGANRFADSRRNLGPGAPCTQKNMSTACGISLIYMSVWETDRVSKTDKTGRHKKKKEKKERKRDIQKDAKIKKK